MDDSLLGAVVLLSPNEVQVAVASSLGSLSTAVLVAAISTTPSDASAFRGRQGTDVTTRRRRRRRRDDRAVVTQAAISPPLNEFAFEWLGSSSQPLRCIDLQFNTEWINSLAFAFDGSFLVSGGKDNCVRLWNIREILGGNADSRPVQMEKQHGDLGVSCIAVSPDNRSIFSGGAQDKTVLIHDSET